MINLSKRLSMNLSLFKPGDTLADVGCDHAYSSIYACENGLCNKAYAMDLREGPLAKAAVNIKAHNLDDRINIILCDGLTGIKPGDADLVLISGMGGILTCKILEESLDTIKAAKQIVLQPQSDIAMVRHFLYDNGLSIVSDDMCFEDGKYYQSMLAVNEAGIPYEYECYYDFGRSLIESKNTVLKEYLDLRIEKINNNMSRMNPDSKTDGGIIRERASVLEALSLYNTL